MVETQEERNRVLAEPSGPVRVSLPRRSLLFIRYLHRKGIIPRGSSWFISTLASLSFPTNRVVKLDLPDVGSLFVDLSDRGQCGYFLCLGLPREKMDISILRSGGRHLKVVFDIGAHIGYYTKLFMKWAPEASIHSFEPSHKSFTLLYMNAAAHPHVCLNPLALAQTTGSKPFFLGRSSDLSSLVRPVGKRIVVDAISVDDYCRKRLISKVDMIKCDVEGSELEVISGARGLLASQSPPIWLLENSVNFRRELGFTEREIVGVFRKYSSQSLSFFYTSAAQNQALLLECDPDHVSWEKAGSNIWVIPQHWKATFLKMAEEGLLACC